MPYCYTRVLDAPAREWLTHSAVEERTPVNVCTPLDRCPTAPRSSRTWTRGLRYHTTLMPQHRLERVAEQQNDRSDCRCPIYATTPHAAVSVTTLCVQTLGKLVPGGAPGREAYLAHVGLGCGVSPLAEFGSHRTLLSGPYLSTATRHLHGRELEPSAASG